MTPSDPPTTPPISATSASALGAMDNPDVTCGTVVGVDWPRGGESVTTELETAVGWLGVEVDDAVTVTVLVVATSIWGAVDVVPVGWFGGRVVDAVTVAVEVVVARGIWVVLLDVVDGTGVVATGVVARVVATGEAAGATNRPTLTVTVSNSTVRVPTRTTNGPHAEKNKTLAPSINAKPCKCEPVADVATRPRAKPLRRDEGDEGTPPPNDSVNAVKPSGTMSSASLPRVATEKASSVAMHAKPCLN